MESIVYVDEGGKKYKVHPNRVDEFLKDNPTAVPLTSDLSQENKDILVELSLIHISEPTRPLYI